MASGWLEARGICSSGSMRTEAELSRNRAAMARVRLQPPHCSAVPANLCVFTLRKHLLASNLPNRARSRFHTSDSTQLPTAICPLHCGPPAGRENCGSGGTMSDGRVVHRQDGEPQIQPKVPLQYMYCGLMNIMCVGRFLGSQSGRQQRHTSCVHVSERSLSRLRLWEAYFEKA